MNKQRLLILAKHLDKHVESSDFDMDSWQKTTTDCGTVACACGHAASIPAFQEAGLRLAKHYTIGGVQQYQLVFGSWYTWNAVEKFFDLSTTDAYSLFYSGSYQGNPTPQDVAKRIEDYVKTSENP